VLSVCGNSSNGRRQVCSAIPSPPPFPTRRENHRVSRGNQGRVGRRPAQYPATPFQLAAGLGPSLPSTEPATSDETARSERTVNAKPCPQFAGPSIATLDDHAGRRTAVRAIADVSPEISLDSRARGRRGKQGDAVTLITMHQLQGVGNFRTCMWSAWRKAVAAFALAIGNTLDEERRLF